MPFILLLVGFAASTSYNRFKKRREQIIVQTLDDQNITVET